MVNVTIRDLPDDVHACLRARADGSSIRTAHQRNSHDACYIALAESLKCTLVTADARLARAPGIRCDIEVLTLG